MKTFFWFVFAILVLGVVFLFGNALRCYNFRYTTKCPEMCLAQKVVCDPLLVPDCADKFSCHAPELVWYSEYIQEKLADWKANLGKK